MIKELIHKISFWALSSFFPQRCIGCNAHDEILCRTCRLQVISPMRAKTKYVNLVIAASSYSSPIVMKAIRAMKYRHATRMAKALGEILSDIIQEVSGIMDNETIIIPIPLSSKKMRIRGYNQAHILSETASKRFGFPIIDKALIKIKDTPSQTELVSKRDRLKNIRGSFAIKPDFTVKDKTILLIDDVMTSGATLNESARILKKEGAKRVFAAVVAKG